MASRTRQFAKLPKDIDTDGNIGQAGLAEGVGGAGVTVYDSTGLLTSVGNTNGDQAYVQSNNRLYLWDSTGWYNVALINRTPTISSITDADGNTTPFTLATDGSTTVITIVAQDSDGEAITYTVTKGTGFDSIATISQDSSVFTITPLSEDSAGSTTSATLTFNATDGSNIASSAAQTFTLQFVQSTWKNVILGIGTSDSDGLANNIYVDRSGNEDGLHLRYGTGDTQSAFHPYLENWSVYFDGTNDYLTGTDTIAPGVGRMTLEAWIKFDDVGDGDQYIMSTYKTSSNDGWRFWFDGTNDKIKFDDGGISLSGNFSPVQGTWYHAAVQVDGGNYGAIYIDGALKHSAGLFPTINAGGDWYIGVNGDTSAGYFNGWISNLRVVTGSSYVYSGNPFTVPDEALDSVSNISLLTCQSNRFIDTSINNRTISTGDNPQITADDPFGEAEYADAANKGSVQFTTSDGISLEIRPSGTTTTYTIEFWYKWDNTSTLNTNHYLFDSRGTSGGETGGALYAYRNGNTYNTGLSGGNATFTNSNFNDGGWHYVVLACDGTNFTWWLDGTRNVTTTGTRTIGTHLWLNSRQTDQYHNASNYADFRVSSTARYASTDTTITVPTAPLGTDDNTTAYYPFDNAGIYDKTGNNIISGDLTTSTTQKKFANTSIYCDGSSKLYIEYNNVDFVASTPFTVEFWLYGNGAGGIISWTGLKDQLDTTLYISSTNNLSFYSGGDITPNSGGSLPASQWNHIAMVRGSDNYVKLYVNGTLYNTSSSTYTSRLHKTYIEIGGYGATYFTGYIENLQMIPGVAKYTANFTAPNSTQGRFYQAES